MRNTTVPIMVGVMAMMMVAVKAYGEGTTATSLVRPSWQERANHVFSNAARLNPADYKTKYMAGYKPDPSAIMTTKYPAVAPFYYDDSLCSAAYSHSLDLATNNCFSHNNCDGTSIWTRIKSFYSCSGTLGENIAAGYADPLATTNQWLCDSVGSACAADGSGSDGHRSNIMGAGYKAIGLGFAYTATSSYKNYWTQDFGGAQCIGTKTPIYAGSHYISGGQIKFMAIYYAAGTSKREEMMDEAEEQEQGSSSSSSGWYSSSSGSFSRPSSSGGKLTEAPTAAPTAKPTPSPTVSPTPVPTSAPTTVAPTSSPSSSPTSPSTSKPTAAPTDKPTAAPTAAPTTAAPTTAPNGGGSTLPAAPGTPLSAFVNVNGKNIALTVDLSKGAGQSLYTATVTASTDAKLLCQGYYFSFTDAKGTYYRYPDTGYLNTYGQGVCVTSFTPDLPKIINEEGANGASSPLQPTYHHVVGLLCLLLATSLLF